MNEVVTSWLKESESGLWRATPSAAATELRAAA
jgi:hypothetical protein